MKRWRFDQLHAAPATGDHSLLGGVLNQLQSCLASGIGLKAYLDCKPPRGRGFIVHQLSELLLFVHADDQFPLGLGEGGRLPRRA